MQFDVNGSRSVEGCLSKKPPMTAGSRVMDKLDPGERKELAKRMKELNASVGSLGKDIESLSSRIPKKTSRIRIGHEGNATLTRSQSSLQRKKEREAKCRGAADPNPNPAFLGSLWSEPRGDSPNAVGGWVAFLWQMISRSRPRSTSNTSTQSFRETM